MLVKLIAWIVQRLKPERIKRKRRRNTYVWKFPTTHSNPFPDIIVGKPPKGNHFSDMYPHRLLDDETSDCDEVVFVSVNGSCFHIYRDCPALLELKNPDSVIRIEFQLARMYSRRLCSLWQNRLNREHPLPPDDV